MKCYKSILIVFLTLLLGTCFIHAKTEIKPTAEELHREQIKKDDEILSKNPQDLTQEELKRLEEIKKAQTIKRSDYEKRNARFMANDQPKTYEEYEAKSVDIKSSDLQDFNPLFEKDPRLSYAPEPEFEVVRYNYPAGSREINLSRLKTTRYARSQGVLSPNHSMVVYSDVNYDVGMRKSSSNVYIIPVNPTETQAQKRAKFLLTKEEQLKKLNEELKNTPDKKSVEAKVLKDKIKILTKEVNRIKASNEELDEQELLAIQNDTPAIRAGKALMQAHIKDKIKKPIMSSGEEDMDYGVQRTLTVVDWSQNGEKLLLKEKIAKDGDGTWQTNIWVYDFKTGNTKKLNEVRQAIEYYWNKNQQIDLHYHRFDIYPLGWDAKHPDRVLLYAYGYNKTTGTSPKFLGTWSIDYKGEQSQLISVLHTGYIVQANGFCLRVKHLEHYER